MSKKYELIKQRNTRSGNVWRRFAHRGNLTPRPISRGGLMRKRWNLEKKTAIIHFLEGKPVDEMNLMQDYWMAALWKFDDDIIGLSLKEQRWQSGFYGQNYRKIWVSWDHLAVIIQECWKRENIYIIRWGLLADRFGLPIRDYWQTVWSANKRLLADRSRYI